MGELKVSAIQTMHHLHVDNIKWETILYNKMRKKTKSHSAWWYTVSKRGKKIVSLLQNLTATFLCHKCTCWWENNGQDLSGEDIAENLLSMSAVHKENYLLTRLNPHLYIFMTAMSHFPSLFMTRAPKSCEILRMSHQPNSLYPSAQFFTKF